MKRFFDTLANIYHNTVSKVKDELGPAYSAGPHRTTFINAGDVIGFNYDGKWFGQRYSLSLFNGKRSISTHYIGQIVSNEFVLEIYQERDRANSSEVLKMPRLNVNWQEVAQFIRHYFLNRLDQLKE